MAKYRVRVAQETIVDLIVEAESDEQATEKCMGAEYAEFWQELEPTFTIGAPERISDEEAAGFCLLEEML